MRRLFCALLSIWAAFAWSSEARGGEAVDYERQIKPLLKESCYACHGALKQEGGLRLDTAAAAIKGGDSGPAIVRGRPEESELINRITSSDESTRMPQEGTALSGEAIGLLKAWIASGAESPAGELPEADPKLHWAFQPPVRPAMPSAFESATQPIDLLLAEKQRELGIPVAGPAPRHILLRRIYLDLVGVPPSRNELRDFLEDDRPDAYERVVDQLLASPLYGERWARHWMDVWRYSDWYGRRSVPDVMNSYPQIWRWRDWIVRSLNDDKGYDRMVQEMLAADELWPGDQERAVATGFIVRNWFKWNYDTWMRDQVEHTGKAFLGLTFQCALCHDHKYDPISQEDHFRFRAIFEPLELRHERVPGLGDPGPFKKYVYAQSYGPIAHGAIRVFDEKLTAETFVYRSGDQRLKIEGKLPQAPGVPAVLGGERFVVRPIELPAAAWYPGLQPFVQREEIGKRQADWRAAVAGVKAAKDRSQRRVAKAKRAAARAELASIKARIAADSARYALGPGNADELAKSASKAERAAKVAAAKAEVAASEAAAALAEAAPADDKKAAAVTAAKAKVETAKKALTAATAELEKDLATYTPLSPMYPKQSTGRRAALARWITDGQNPLTSRVAANHLWRWHFGKPLVETVTNFGRSGKPPSHPELLDWLAVEFVEGEWSMKRMHRVMVTSEAYRRDSEMTNDEAPMTNGQGEMTNDEVRMTNDQAPMTNDPDNTYYGQFNSARMEAEVVRDSLLAVAGELEFMLGGPEIDHAQGLTSRRRSLYFAHHGESKMEFLELFDGASATDCYERATSIRPQQALAMANNDLAIRMSRLLAARLSEPADENNNFISAAFEQVISRSPTGEEQAAAARFVEGQAKLYQESKVAGDAALRARESLIRVLLNHHDFMTVR